MLNINPTQMFKYIETFHCAKDLETKLKYPTIYFRIHKILAYVTLHFYMRTYPKLQRLHNKTPIITFQTSSKCVANCLQILRSSQTYCL